MNNRKSICFETEQKHRHLAPMQFTIAVGSGIYYEVKIDNNLIDNALTIFDIVVAAEMYDYAVQQYIKYHVGEVPESIIMLLIHHEAAKQLYKTLPLHVKLRKVDKDSIVDVGAIYDNRYVLPFDVWNSTQSYDSSNR